jgi:8-hydroxy-5-deazaflavin:NADPH oxidoreductase
LRVTAAFHHMSAALLQNPEIEEIDSDVMVLGDHGQTPTECRHWPAVSPACGVYARRLRNAHQVASLVADLISANRRYKAHAGLPATDI